MKFVKLVKAEEKFDKSRYHEVLSDIQFMWNGINEYGKATDEDKKMFVGVLKRTWDMSIPEMKKAVDDFEHGIDGSLDLQEVESSKIQSNGVKEVEAEQQEDTLIEQVKSEISYLEENLDNAINNCRVIESIFEQLGIHSADIKPYLENYLESFLKNDDNPSVSEFRNRLDEYLYSSSPEDEDQDN